MQENSGLASTGNTYGRGSRQLYDRAVRVMPGGNTRHTIFTPPHPQYALRASGCRVWDVEGVERVDFVNNYSSLIHGHCRPEIVEAVTAQLHDMSAVSLPTEAEVLLAELICDRVSSIEQIRFVNSGSEAVMMAVKAARAFTGRPNIAKIEGAFHGGYDPTEVSILSTPENWGPEHSPNAVPLCAGTPQSVCDSVLVLPLNNGKTTRELIEARADELAAILIDPFVSRMCFAEASRDYLQMLREVTKAHGILLIFDEVYSFRIGYGGAQDEVCITPDLTCLGKIIGGGFPVGAVGGPASIMSVFDMRDGMPPVPHGGTYNANPVTMVAGRVAMELMTPGEFDRLNGLGEKTRNGLRQLLERLGLQGEVMGKASLACLLPGAAAPIKNFRGFTAFKETDRIIPQLQDVLMTKGIMCAANGTFILSTAMTDTDIDFMLAMAEASLREIL